jgi:inosine/xanthosine triphosphatase
MKKVIVASENPVKLNVTKKAFSALFPNEEFEFVAIKSDSGVSDQPINDDTLKGALNRLRFIKTKYPEADYWISQEGGLYTEDNRYFNRAWIAVSDQTGYIAKASTASFYLPTKITEYINQGLELGDANDKFFSSINSKQGMGAVGHLTDGILDRENYYLPAAVIALSELKHKDWFIGN